MNRWLPTLLGAALAAGATAVCAVAYVAFPNVKVETRNVPVVVKLAHDEQPGRATAKLARFLPAQLEGENETGLLPDGRSFTCRWYANTGADLAAGTGLNWAVQACVVNPGGPSG